MDCIVCKEGCLQVEIRVTFVWKGEKLECMCTDRGSSFSQDSFANRNRSYFIQVLQTQKSKDEEKVNVRKDNT